MEALALRLHPNQDLKSALDAFTYERGLEAACILSCVGSLRRAAIRFADRAEVSVLDDKFEIVSLTGTLSIHGSHYHIAIADGQGCTLGGHLMEGCLVYTTAEIVVGVLPNLSFLREHDNATGFDELSIHTIT